MAAVTLHIKHHRDDGVEKIDVDQILTGGLRGTSECRTLDWAEREHTDYIFGRVMGRSRRVALDTVEDAFLRDGWVAHDHGLIESFVLSADNAWTAQQVSPPPPLDMAVGWADGGEGARSGASRRLAGPGAMCATSSSSRTSMAPPRPSRGNSSMTIAGRCPGLRLRRRRRCATGEELFRSHCSIIDHSI